MPKIKYTGFKFRADTLAIIEQANDIVAQYQQQGLNLTLRQLYYQFVSRDLLGNTVQNYKRLGGIINDGRLAGLIDWTAIEDRTRGVESVSHWDSPEDILRSAASSFRIDKWEGQKNRPEVWIEKEALAGVVQGVCRELDISYLSCRGYTSQSEMWASAMRMQSQIENYQNPIILHFGDHDPSGIDMTRDITDRITDVFGVSIELRRMALNMSQIEEYSPPPNPAKETDSRFADYKKKFGDESWELDALEPNVLIQMIRDTVVGLRDNRKWGEKVAEEESHRQTLRKLHGNWESVEEFSDGLDDPNG